MSVIGRPLAPRIWADLEALAEFRDSTAGGWSRPVFSEAYTKSRRWIVARMEEVGLEVDTDPIGNVVGRLRGRGRLPQALATGSHTDTVRAGGRFDGIVGVLGAIEAVRLLQKSRTELEHDLLVIDFFGEEANEFGLSCLGSRAMAGTLREEHLLLTDPTGQTLAEALAGMGSSPAEFARARLGGSALAAFLELHIEQGPILEKSGVSLGAVTSIAGIQRLVVTLIGRPDHAGTTPTKDRRDALCGAAEVALHVEDLGRSGGVSNTGRIECEPGGYSIVPARARVWAEFRSSSSTWLADRRKQVEDGVARIAAARRLAGSVEWVSALEPVKTSRPITKVLRTVMDQLAYSHTDMHSGAGHDSVHMAQLCPIGMIFVPSVGGRSHCPDEHTTPDQVASGVHVLAQALSALDRAI